MIRKTSTIHLLLAFFLLLLCSCTSKKENRLANASSPYLQQHADNPVDWYEWGDEALQLAKKENKPLLISVGYASCHWCHVMEKESFMDTAVARIMNENFICIKVDREERPDIDNIYTNACQIITGSSGWPLNAFALPDGKPFFAGTYYSKQSWMSLLNKITTAYKQQNNKLVLQAHALTNGIANADLSFLKPDEEPTLVSKDLYQNLFDSLYSEMDLRNGGLKGAPKFPMPSTIEFLLQYYHLTENENALDVATTSLTRMALGGIYDHVGGGFARYAVDSLWRIPHFEKMLYDNAQLMSVYAHAYQVTKNVFFKNVIKEIAAFVERDLTASDGGFYSSLNADTEAGEGEYYAWELKEIRKLTPQSADLISRYFNISEQGNWKDKKNILFANTSPGEFAATNNLAVANWYNMLGAGKKILHAERNKREKPATDQKILTSWNALMLKAYADAYAALGEEEYLNKAITNASFLATKMMSKDGHVWRNYTNGKTSIDGFLDDYSLLAKAFIRLYQVTFDIQWLNLAKQLTDYAVKHFYDEKSGMFFYTAHKPGGSLVVRKMEILDNVIPSSNGVMAEVLYNLATYFEVEDYLNKSSRMISNVSGELTSAPAFYSQWCFLTGMLAHGTNEVAIMGSNAQIKNIELQKNYLPNCIFLGNTENENLPLLKDKLSVNKTLVYVCTNKTCKSPVEDTQKALQQLTRTLPIL